ncbi:MAG: phosphoadenosine phosphosulfate reductase family protein, partial [Flavobacteriales bacterium]|nr:phosphoadenosine phosphosulfate reductase family protein [Flavobacteriales bacterium]
MPTFDEFQERVRTFQSDGMALFATTSFQGHSVPMLHMLARIDVHIPVYYVDTGYLFPETLRFRDQLKEMLGLTFVGLRPAVPKSQQRDA